MSTLILSALILQFKEIKLCGGLRVWTHGLEEQTLGGVLGEVRGGNVAPIAGVPVDPGGLGDVDLRQAHVLRAGGNEGLMSLD